MDLPSLPPFTAENAAPKARMSGDASSTRSLAKVAVHTVGLGCKLPPSTFRGALKPRMSQKCWPREMGVY